MSGNEQKQSVSWVYETGSRQSKADQGKNRALLGGLFYTRRLGAAPFRYSLCAAHRARAQCQYCASETAHVILLGSQVVGICRTYSLAENNI
jgi:hypothetical protein